MNSQNYKKHKEKGESLAEQMTLTELASQMRNSAKGIDNLRFLCYNSNIPNCAK